MVFSVAGEEACRGEGSHEEADRVPESFPTEPDIQVNPVWSLIHLKSLTVFFLCTSQSPGTEEFASDALHPAGEEISRESVKVELGQLGMASSPEKGDGGEGGMHQWEADLQAELRDLDIQGLEEGGGEGVEDEAWEAELEQMLDMHSEHTDT